jgi:hypothetical protein
MVVGRGDTPALGLVASAGTGTAGVARKEWEGREAGGTGAGDTRTLVVTEHCQGVIFRVEKSFF